MGNVTKSQITAKDLRVGNVMYNPITERYMIVNGDTIKYLELIESDPGCGNYLGIPVQLTPEILEKCGFVNGKLGDINVGYTSDDFVKEVMSVVFEKILF